MKISIDEFGLLEEWSKLSLNRKERKSLYQDLERILESLSAIEDVVDNGKDLHGEGALTIDDLREDKTAPSMDRNFALKNAPKVEEGMIKVPIILD